MFHLILTFFLLAVILCVVFPSINLREVVTDIIEYPPTVTQTVVSAYMGRWYQVFGSNVTYQQNGYCITADYKLQSQYSFSVLNSENYGSPFGEIKTFEASARLPDSNYPGRWIIEFEAFPGDPTNRTKQANYWIIQLSDLNQTTYLYDWAVVSVPLGYEVHVLARDVDSFKATVGPSVLQGLANQGFNNPQNTPFESYQGPDCAYNSE